MSVLPARTELKFVIDAAQREAVLDACREALAPDPFAEEGSYRVTSQYYDAPDLRWYWEKVDGISVRRKLRLRCYGAPTEGPALAQATTFLEIKHRRGDKLSKERVRLADARPLLEDAALLGALAEHLAPGEARRGAGTASRIERDAEGLRLIRSAIVTYRREAYVGTLDDRLRLTFDHDVQGLSPGCFLQAPAGGGAPLLPPTRVVMELKYDRRLPGWARQAFVAAKVVPRRFSKYARAVEELGLRP